MTRCDFKDAAASLLQFILIVLLTDQLSKVKPEGITQHFLSLLSFSSSLWYCLWYFEKHKQIINSCQDY